MWRKKVKAGVLLYALVMAGLFSLVLQFYLHRQEANQALLRQSRERREAYAMALLAQDNLSQTTQSFDKGEAQLNSDSQTIQVTSKSGTTYAFVWDSSQKKQESAPEQKSQDNQVSSKSDSKESQKSSD